MGLGGQAGERVPGRGTECSQKDWMRTGERVNQRAESKESDNRAEWDVSIAAENESEERDKGGHRGMKQSKRAAEETKRQKEGRHTRKISQSTTEMYVRGDIHLDSACR
ncbi:hypothetical protein MWG46_00225 [Escherichia coli]|nr:hypothetical protein [Escherichia coli]